MICTLVTLVGCGSSQTAIAFEQPLAAHEQIKTIHDGNSEELELSHPKPVPEVPTQMSPEFSQTGARKEKLFLVPSQKVLPVEKRENDAGRSNALNSPSLQPSPIQPFLGESTLLGDAGTPRGGNTHIDGEMRQTPATSKPVTPPDRLPNATPIVRTVEIRFVNAAGESVDQEGKPIEGRTPRDFIANEIKLRPGDALSEDAIQADLRQLQQLGLFDRVDVSVVPEGTNVDVFYNIKERSARSVNFGGGYNDDVGVFGTVGFRDSTVGRIHQRVEANAEVSRENIDYDVRFINPYRVGTPGNLGYSLRVFRDRSISGIFDEDVDLLNGERVRERRFGGSIFLTRPINQWWTTLGLNFTRTSTRDRAGNLATQDELSNPLTFSGTGIDDLYTVSLSLTRDKRDNPYNPTQGSILTLGTEQSIPIGVGNILQNRLTGNYIQYVPVRLLSSDQQNNDPKAFPELFAFNLQAGTVIGDLAPHQAFRLGGINSVRGYEENALGSARTYVLASGEYRFPIASRVGGVFFVDFASDLGSGYAVPGEPAVVRNKPGTGLGAGVGVRWHSPFGLVRLDVGVNDQGDVRFYTQLGTGTRF